MCVLIRQAPHVGYGEPAHPGHSFELSFAYEELNWIDE